MPVRDKRAYRAARIAAGLCRECGKPRGSDGTNTMCRRCANRASHLVRQARDITTAPERAARKAARQKRRAEQERIRIMRAQCRDCGVERIGATRRGRCPRCKAEREAARERKRYAAVPKAVHAERTRKWRAANPGRRDASDRRYRAANTERIRERQRKAAKADPVGRRAKEARAQARRRAAHVAPVTAADIREMMERQRGRCALPWCGTDLAATRYHVDHVVPIAKGGTHEPANVQLLCPRCNQTKSAKLPETFAQEHGRLF